jgi:hypothetical protein
MSSAYKAIKLWLSPPTSYSIQFEWICSISRRSSLVSSFIHRGWIADALIPLQDRTFVVEIPLRPAEWLTQIVPLSLRAS